MDKLAQGAKDLTSGGGDGNQSGGQDSGMDKQIDQGVFSTFARSLSLVLSPLSHFTFSLPLHISSTSSFLASYKSLAHAFEYANASPTGVDQVAGEEGVPKAADGAINKEVNSEVGKFT